VGEAGGLSAAAEDRATGLRRTGIGLWRNRVCDKVVELILDTPGPRFDAFDPGK
jgi:hypothetical protein